MHVLSVVLIASGLLLILWALVIWRWGDPVTAAWYRVEQHRLEASYHRNEAASGLLTVPAPPPVLRTRREESVPAGRGQAAPEWPELRARLAAAARAYRVSLSQGHAVGEIAVPRLGLRTIVVDGTSSADLRKGPGLDSRTSLPGRGRLVYIAGHRTTFGAPFAAIDALRAGDSVELRLPYATFRYAVTGHRIVGSNEVAVLRPGDGRERLVLQACHPRFFASQRYLVDARLVEVVFRGHSGAVTVRVPPGS